MDLPDNDHLHRAVVELGEPDALFRVSRARFLTKLVVGVALVAFGIVANYFWWVRGPATPDHLVMLVLVGAPLSGLSLLLHMYRNRGLCVLLYPTGLLRLRRGEVDSFPWAEIESVRLKVQRAELETDDPDATATAPVFWLPVEVPTFKLGEAGLCVTRADGAEVTLGPALSDYPALAEEIQKRTFAALWPAASDTFRAGTPVTFGDIEVSPAGVRYAGKLLRWRDLKEITVAQGHFSIKQTGKWLPWALVDVYSVPNPHVLFALLTEGRKRFAPREEEPHGKGREQPGS
jgi:hypothetical protein